MSIPLTRRRAVEAAFFLGVVLIVARSIQRSAPARFVPAGPSPRAAAGSAAASADDAASAPDRPYVRRLKIEEPPLPGGVRAPRAVAETAPSAQLAAGAAASASALMSPDLAFGGQRGATYGAASAGVPANGAAPERAPEGGAAAGPASDTAGLPIGTAAHIVAASRDLKSGAGSGSDSGAGTGTSGELTPQSVATSLMRGLEDGRKLDVEIRRALAGLGAGAPLESQQSAVAAALKAHGLSADADSVAAALSLATAPPRPAPSPAAVSAAVNDIATHIPDKATQAEILQHVDDVKPVPTGPPPKNAAEVYRKYRDVLDQAQKEYGVPPEIIISELSVETSFGADMGKKQLVGVLLTLETQPKTAARAKGDLQALTTLSADGDLGAMKPSDVPSNYAGAYGPPQFLASSQLAYGRSADGKGSDLFQFPNSILSIANYLQKNGYARSPSAAIFAYNHSQDYVNTVLSRAASIKPLLKDAPAAPSN